MKNVFLHGRLGDRFGKKWVLSVASPEEAIRALFANEPAIQHYLANKQKEGVVYGVKKTKTSAFIEGDEWGMQTPGSLHIFPVPQGAAGFALNLLIAVATTAASMYISKKMAEAMERDDSTVSSETKSFIFNGGANRYQQGATIPLGYGRMKVGTNVISSCVSNYDYDSDKGQIFNFKDGLYSLVPQYSKYFNPILGSLGSAYLLKVFDGSSAFSIVDPAFDAIKRLMPTPAFGTSDGQYGFGYDPDRTKAEAYQCDNCVEGNQLGGFFIYRTDYAVGINKEKLGHFTQGGNWYPDNKADPANSSPAPWFQYRVSGGNALNSSFVGLQSVPQLDTDANNDTFFYPITIVDKGAIPNDKTPTLIGPNAIGSFPVQVGQRWRAGNKSNGAAWFKLESASIYKAIDLVCEGPIEGFSNNNGESLPFTRGNTNTNSNDNYLQGVFLDETPVKELTNGGGMNSQPSYNINEFDIDMATNKAGSIGVEDQQLLENQYLFSANTIEINGPLYGPRSTDIATVIDDPGSTLDFEIGLTYKKGDIVKVTTEGNPFLYKIATSLNTEFSKNGNYAGAGDGSQIPASLVYKGAGSVDFFEATDNINEYKTFSGEYVEYLGINDPNNKVYVPGDKVRASEREGTDYYKMGEDASKFLGVFDPSKSYGGPQIDNGYVIMSPVPGGNPTTHSVSYEITGDYAQGDQVDGRDKLIHQFAKQLTATSEGEQVMMDPLYIYKKTTNTKVHDIVGELLDITPGEALDLADKIWQKIIINGPNDIKNAETNVSRNNLGIFAYFGELDQALSRMAEEEYYVSHTVINPLVEELYISLQIDELAYVYEGDSVKVTYKISLLWAVLIGALAVYAGYEAIVDATWPPAAALAPYAVVLMFLLFGLIVAFLTNVSFTIGTKIENSGELWPNRARFRIKYGNVGETPYVTDIYINGVATSPYIKDVKIYLPPNPSQSDRTVKVFKLNRERNPVVEGETAARYKEKMSLASITEITPVTLNYPNSVVIGTRVNAKDVASIPTRNYNLKLKRVAVPTNYNPETREYTGPWNGLFKGQNADDKNAVVPEAGKEWTDNPAWCLYDLISDRRYGVGKFGIRSENIDKWTLYKVAKYCDQMVPTGYSSKYLRRKFTPQVEGGLIINIESTDVAEFAKEFYYPGKMLAFYYEDKSFQSIQIKEVDNSRGQITLASAPKSSPGLCAVAIDYPLIEPRYTLNAFLMNSQNAFKLINEIAAVFRTYAYWAGGAINFFHDEPKDSVMLFANNNISKEGFSYSSTPKTSRTNSCKIRYLDKYNMFRPKMEYSEDITAIQENTIIEQKIDGFGITSQAQAKRATEFLVQTANLETEIVSFETNTLGSYLRPGDIIQVLDNKRTVGRFAGKVLDIIVSGDGKAADLDIDFPVRTVIDEDDVSTWKKITLYTLSGNQTIESLSSLGAVSDQEINDLRAAQIGEYLVGQISNNDTRLRIINNPYSFVTGEYTWSEALMDARGRGGMLGTINSNVDQSQVQAVLPKDGLGWIGGYNREIPAPEKFIWYQPQDCDGDGISYFSWAEGFPKVGDPLETDILDGEDNIQADDLDDSWNISADPLNDDYGNYIAVSGSTNNAVNGDWVTLSGSTGIGYILETRANNSLLALNGIAGTTFRIEDSVNLANKYTYKVVNVAEKSNGIFAVQGVQYNSGKFGRIEENLSLVSPASPVIFTQKNIEAPASVLISAMDEDITTNTPYGLQASWVKVNGAASYRVQFFEGNILLSTFEVPHSELGETQAQVYRSEILSENGSYSARVASIGFG
jgi:predicted phage tail protein